MSGETSPPDRSLAWMKLMRNPGWAELIIAKAAGETVPLPPDEPSRIRLIPLLHALNQANPEQLQAAVELAQEFLERTQAGEEGNDAT